MPQIQKSYHLNIHPSCKDMCDNFEEIGNKLEQMCKIYQHKCSAHELFTLQNSWKDLLPWRCTLFGQGWEVIDMQMTQKRT